MTKSDVAYLQGRMFVIVLCIGVIAVPAFLVGVPSSARACHQSDRSKIAPISLSHGTR